MTRMHGATTQSTARLLADQLIPDFDDYVRSLRDSGESWRAISRHLVQRTGGVLNVSHETLRRWCER